MSLDAVTALLLIAVPIVFNVAFFELGGRSTTRTSSAASRTRSCAGSTRAGQACCSAGTC